MADSFNHVLYVGEKFKFFYVALFRAMRVALTVRLYLDCVSVTQSSGQSQLRGGKTIDTHVVQP